MKNTMCGILVGVLFGFSAGASATDDKPPPGPDVKFLLGSVANARAVGAEAYSSVSGMSAAKGHFDVAGQVVDWKASNNFAAAASGEWQALTKGLGAIGTEFWVDIDPYN